MIGSKIRRMIIWQLISMVAMGYLAFVFLNLLYARAKGAPIVYASPEAIRQCWQLAGLRKGEMALDLGCGNARSLIIAVQEFGARGIGVEATWYGYLTARWLVWRHGLGTKVRIYQGNIHRAGSHIAQADVIYLYLFPELLAQIEESLFTHLRSDSRVVSLAFALSRRQPEKEIDVTNLRVATKIRLYRPARQPAAASPPGSHTRAGQSAPAPQCPPRATRPKPEFGGLHHRTHKRTRAQTALLFPPDR